MKKLIRWQLFLLLAAVPVFFTSCGDDDEAGPQILLPKLDGFYVFGTNTVAADPGEAKARMAVAVLDNSKAPNVSSSVGVYGKLMYIGANSTIQFAEVKDKVGVIYGAESGGTVEAGADIGNVNVTDNVIHGMLLADGDAIKVADEGLYYVFVNSKTGFFDITRVKLNIIGDATPGNWAEGTALPQVFTSKDSTVFQATMTLKKESGYRYRLANGWAVYEEAGVLTTLSSMGVVSYGESWPLPANDIGFYQENAPHQTSGQFTITMTYIAATDKWVEKKVTDYSNIQMAIVGNGTEGGTWEGNGTGGFGLKKPAKDGSVFTWTYTDVPLVTDGEFIFLQDATWNNLLIDYLGATVNGTAVTAGDVINAQDEPVNGENPNFFVVNGGSYDITLKINAATNARTVTINK